MGCGCNKNKNSNVTRVTAYRKKHLGYSNVKNKPSKTKEQLRAELIERMRRATGGK